MLKCVVAGFGVVAVLVWAATAGAAELGQRLPIADCYCDDGGEISVCPRGFNVEASGFFVADITDGPRFLFVPRATDPYINFYRSFYAIVLEDTVRKSLIFFYERDGYVDVYQLCHNERHDGPWDY